MPVLPPHTVGAGPFRFDKRGVAYYDSVDQSNDATTSGVAVDFTAFKRRNAADDGEETVDLSDGVTDQVCTQAGAIMVQSVGASGTPRLEVLFHGLLYGELLDPGGDTGWRPYFSGRLSLKSASSTQTYRVWVVFDPDSI